MRLLLPLTALVLLTWSAETASAQRIEAVKGKQYRLTKKHGPWMIMVASLRDRKDFENRTEGLSATEAADELVYYLRKKGIPAYTFKQQEVEQAINTVDRRGRNVQRKYQAQWGDISVIAGNYDRAASDVAQKTLAYIKKLDPPVLRDQNNGAAFKPTKGQPTPLSGAFLTINPVLTPEEAKGRQRDPVVASLNTGQEYSLLGNKGKYTVVVASFYGKSLTLKNTQASRQKAREFQVGDGLDRAGNDAWMVAKLIRKNGYEAWVYHDRHRSIVTVGSFNNPRDPEISKIAQEFGAKVKNARGKLVLTAEAISLPGDTPNSPPKDTWILDPSPQLIEVPKW